MKLTVFNACICTPPDPTLTVETVLSVMEKVTDSSAEEVWRYFIGGNTLEDIKSKCSTERELMHTCADNYVNCDPDSSWEQIASGLYRKEETAAVEEVRSYLNPRGRFSKWVWFVIWSSWVLYVCPTINLICDTCA